MARVEDFRFGGFSNLEGFIITKSMAKELGDEAVPLARARVEEIAQGEYRNLMRNLRQKLAPSGMRGGSKVLTGGASANLSFSRTDGTNGRIRTKPWPPFRSKKYAMRKPKSYRFWYKTGKLFQAWIRLSAPTVTVQELQASRSHHKGRINTKFLLRFDPLDAPVSGLKLRESFMEGKRLPIDRDTVKGLLSKANREGVGRALIPETDRSWMRDMAAALGKDLRKNLRKI